MTEEMQRLLLMGVGFLAIGVMWYLTTTKKNPARKDDSLLKNLTNLAKEKKMDPVVGREEEVERMIQIISRRTKNNPLLLGEPGVGKTAIVEGLALRIAAGDVPDFLKSYQILELSMSELIAGTKYRGEFEDRLQKIMKELEATPGHTILFIDEIHILEQTKGTEGALSASDVLKPALARRDLSIIGATTLEEYETYIRTNPALDRRFQPVLVAEPSRTAALAVLRGVAKLYEAHHDVIIDDDALVSAVELSDAFLKERRLPDKALDLVDEAAAKVAMEAAGAHRMNIGLMHEAAEAARARAKKEAVAVAREAKHLHELNKEFPADPALTAAGATLDRHVRELARVAEREDEAGRPRVVREDVEAVVRRWKKLATQESRQK